MANYVDGRVVIITGASSGFGKLTAEKAAAMGAKVVCCARREDMLKELVEGIRAKGGVAEYVVTDVGKREDVEHAVAFTVEKFGCVDCLINNAGTMPTANYSDHKMAMGAWETCVSTNLMGTLYGICAVYDQMVAQGRGQVISVSSIWGKFPLAGSPLYGAVKAAVVYLTEALRQEAAGVIKTTIIRPSATVGTELAKTKVVQTNRSNMVTHKGKMMDTVTGKLGEDYKDNDSPKYMFVSADELTDGIIFALNQPWGYSMSDITVRATGEFLAL